MGAIFDILIYQPFSWILLMLYRVTSSYGMALILFQLVIKVITLPLSIKGKRGMMQQTLLQPRLKELEAQFKGDKQKYQAAMSELYQKEGVNPMSGCLWSLIPMPIFFMVFAIVRQPLTYLMGLKGPEGAAQIAKLVEAFNLESGADIFYQEMQLASLMFQNQDVAIRAVPELFNATFINFHFLGLDLSMRPEVAFHPLIIIPILSAASAYLMGWCTNKFNGTKVEGKGKTMQMLMPLMSLWFGFIMPAGMGVYWIANSGFSIVQEYYLTKRFKKEFADAAAARERREEQRRLAEAEVKAENQKRREEQEAARKEAARKAQSKYKLKKKPGEKK